ncbi:MAG: surface-adhesin E family protein [Hylemonella sp.]
MRPFKILALALALGGTPGVWAEWVRVVETDRVDFYIDTASINKAGHLRRVWEMQNLKQRDKDGEFSRHAMTEYDCKLRRTRILSLFTHEEPMARGRILLRIDGPLPWVEIAENTIDETYLRLLCFTQLPERLML